MGQAHGTVLWGFRVSGFRVEGLLFGPGIWHSTMHLQAQRRMLTAELEKSKIEPCCNQATRMSPSLEPTAILSLGSGLRRIAHVC